MRCKNCGTYNDDNRYICETCGSPLYDEENIDNTVPANDKTQTFNTVTNPITDEPVNQPSEQMNNNKPENPKDGTEKKSIIVIAILVVVLVAVIASVAVVASSKSKAKEDTTTEISTTQESTERTTVSTTQQTTEKRTTTTTTTTTTTQQTTVQTWYINVSSSGGGSVSGAGQFNNGSKVTITASADDGYVFDGWYSDGVKVSNKAKYSFTANENKSFSAVFNPVETPDNNGTENMNDMD